MALKWRSFFLEWQFSFVSFEITVVKNGSPELSLFCSILELEVILDLILCTFVGQSWASIAAGLYLLVKETNYKTINVRQVTEEMTKWFWGVASGSTEHNLAFGTRLEPAVWWELKRREDGGTGKFLSNTGSWWQMKCWYETKLYILKK